MDLKAQCELSMYEDISPISGTATLVRGNLDGQLYVRKVHSYYDAGVYKALCGKPHPNLATVFGVYETENGLITVEQYINGVTLEQRLAVRIPLREQEAVRIIDGVANALQFLHRQHPPVIHRDVKPANVMLTDEGTVKLIDFNAARQYNENSTKDTELLGTSGYAAPEQYGFTQTDVRTDIYSLGILFLELLGYTPEGAATYTGRLAGVIRKATSFSPGERYANITAFRAELAEVTRATPETQTAQAHRSFLPPGFRSRTLWKMLVALAYYLFIVVVVFLMNFSNDPLRGPLYNFVGRAIVVIYMLGLAALWTNYLGIWRYLPLVSSGKWLVKAVGYVIFTLLFTLLFFLIIAFYIAIFKAFAPA